MTEPTDAAKAEMKVLADEANNLTPEQKDTPDEHERKQIALWQGRFTRAENYRRAHIDRMNRMYKLYRAYRDATNYAYGTNIMPPVGFEIVETIKPRLASADIDITLQPTKQENIDDPLISEWESLVEYDLSVLGGDTGFDDLKIMWINSMLIFGNGPAQLSWDGDENGHPYLEIVDPYLFYPDPKATNRLLDSRWEIKQTFKDKAVIVSDEKKRGSYSLYDAEKLKEIEDKPIKLDPRVDRVNINTLRMGQVNDGKMRGQATDAGPGTSATDKNTGESQVEIWECWDHVTNKLQVIFNREKLMRDDDNPYMRVRGGRMFIDLPDISLNWEYYAMSHLEPVETTIYEMADSRNQAMDDIVFSLDPIRKIKKGKGYKPEDLKHAPGAVWELDNVTDVTIETGPNISSSWIAKDNILRQSIQTALALSEYTQGIPNSGTEPVGKVELLLMQTNIRFSLLVRQMEIAFTDLVNAMIQMNQEFLGDTMEYRITGTKISFKSFGPDAKTIGVDARVDIQPKPEKSAVQEANETVALYKALVTDDTPQQGADPAEVDQFKKRKRAMQRMLIRAFGKGEYEDELMGPDTRVQAKPAPAPTPLPAEKPGGIVAQPAIAPELQNPAPQPVSVMPPETSGLPGVGGSPQGFLARLLARVRQ